MNANLERVINLIAEQGGHDGSHLSSSSSLLMDCGMDSLDRMEFALTVEDEFDVEFSDREVEDMVTVGDIVRMLKEKGVEED
jgi:acyl carrier protein